MNHRFKYSVVFLTIFANISLALGYLQHTSTNNRLHSVGIGSLSKEKSGVFYRFNGVGYRLGYTMRLSKNRFSQKGGLSRAYLDTIASCYYPYGRSGLVEILRQDVPINPTLGIALGFEFDSAATKFPYFPEKSTIQIRNFSWGGIEFSSNDSLNYTGVTNEISDDVFLEVISFQNDTIEGRFSGLLLSGSGLEGQLDSGYFKVRLYYKR